MLKLKEEYLIDGQQPQERKFIPMGTPEQQMQLSAMYSEFSEILDVFDELFTRKNQLRLQIVKLQNEIRGTGYPLPVPEENWSIFDSKPIPE